MKILQPPGWPNPKGYSNGVAARGTMVFVGGIVGWNDNEVFEATDFPGQARQAFKNILSVLAEADAGPEHITRFTWYVRDKQDYLSALKEVGQAYRDTIGRHYPAMALIEVSDFVEDAALMEIETTAVVPD